MRLLTSALQKGYSRGQQKVTKGQKNFQKNKKSQTISKQFELNSYFSK